MTLAHRMIVMNAGVPSRSARRWTCTQSRDALRRRVHRLAVDELPAGQGSRRQSLRARRGRHRAIARGRAGRGGHADHGRHPARAPASRRRPTRPWSPATVEMVEQLGADTLVHIAPRQRHGHRAPAARHACGRRRDDAPDRRSGARLPVRLRDWRAACNERSNAWPYPRLCAHRGAGKLAPENTLTAMRVGLAHGYTMVEFDVKLAADNVAFLLHDATLDRTTSGRGRADALPWRELSRLDAGGWHSAKYAGEMIPTFAAIARWARAHGVLCNIEIKPTPGRERETGAAVALDAAALWRDADVPPLLSSFSEAALGRCARRRARAAARVAARRAAGRLAGAPRAPSMRGARRRSQVPDQRPRGAGARQRLSRVLLYAERTGARARARRVGRGHHHHRRGRTQSPPTACLTPIRGRRSPAPPRAAGIARFLPRAAFGAKALRTAASHSYQCGHQLPGIDCVRANQSSGASVTRSLIQ